MNFFDDEDKKYEYLFCYYVMTEICAKINNDEHIFINSPYFTYDIIVNNINNPTILMLYDMLMINEICPRRSFDCMYIGSNKYHSYDVVKKHIDLVYKLNNSKKYTSERYIVYFILSLLTILEKLIKNFFYNTIIKNFYDYDIFLIYLKYINKIFNFDNRDIFILFSKNNKRFNCVEDLEKYINKIEDKFVVDEIKNIFCTPIISNTKGAHKINN